MFSGLRGVSPPAPVIHCSKADLELAQAKAVKANKDLQQPVEQCARRCDIFDAVIVWNDSMQILAAPKNWGEGG